jgi:hypothetical protein
MVDAYIGVRYALGDKQAVTAGNRYQYVSLYHGTENTSADISWDKATSVQRGFTSRANSDFKQKERRPEFFSFCGLEPFL